MPVHQIFYFAYSHNRPTGGQKGTYKHVDVLNELGFRAFVLHRESDFRLTWFENSTSVVGFEECRAMYQEGDFFVLPEEMGSTTLAFPGRKIIYNHGLYLTYLPFKRTVPQNYPFLDKSVVAMFAASEDNRTALEFAHPRMAIFSIPPMIDSEKFRYVPLDLKAKVIACSQKSEKATTTLFHLLQTRAQGGFNKLSEFEWTFVEACSENEIIHLFRRSVLLVFLNYEEGLPQMPLEAMSSGCLVAGYGAGPMKECLLPESRFEPGNMRALCEFVESVVEGASEGQSQWQSLSEKGAYHANQFSKERLRRNLLNAWGTIFRQTEVGR